MTFTIPDLVLSEHSSRSRLKRKQKPRGEANHYDVVHHRTR